jgi:hypothetical protein
VNPRHYDSRLNALGGSTFPNDFRDFIRALNEQSVEYLLVGGYAAGVYGHVRATSDIDFFYRATAENVERLVRALVAFGAPAGVIDPPHLRQQDTVTSFGAPPMRIDLLASISGVDYEDAASEAIYLDLEGDRLPVIGLAALRVNKMASGRARDRDDLERLPTG